MVITTQVSPEALNGALIIFEGYSADGLDAFGNTISCSDDEQWAVSKRWAMAVS